MLVPYLLLSLAVIIEKIMLVNGEVKRNDGGNTRVVLKYRKEEERIKASEECTGIKLMEEELAGIKGGNVELRVRRYY